MNANSLLLGPPELYPKPTADTTQHGLENIRISGTTPEYGFTENNSLTYTATGNPCLDFFFHVVPTTPSESVIKRVKKAWDFDPLTTLKLICNLRGVRGTGKSDKERFYAIAMWLHKNHPKTLAKNVRVFAEFGCYKDLLEILFRLVEGEDVRIALKRKRHAKMTLAGRGALRRFYLCKKKQHGKRMPTTFSRRIRGKNWPMPVNSLQEKKQNSKKLFQRDVRILQNEAKIEATRRAAKAITKEKNIEKAKKAFERYLRDPIYRYLHDCIAEMFAQDLKQDMECLNANKLFKISLASKWCPSIDSSYDKATLICENIARRIFPKESYPEYEGIEDAHYAYRVRDRLRKQVLVPLHKALELPEVYMSANKWFTLPYNRVPSVAMKNYKEHFLRHDKERFHKYLEDVKRGDAKIAAGALLPHEIIESLNDGDGGEVAELQWARMVNDMLKIGKLKNCIAVCDVSGSMNGTPMEVCVSLGLLISELSEEPWKGRVITFSAKPQMHIIKGETLLQKTNFIRGMDWGSNTNFQKVFDRILEVAVNGGLSEEQMIKRVFVFSDMEFDQASGGHYVGYSYGRYDSSDSDEDEYSDYSDMDSDVETHSKASEKNKEVKKKQTKEPKQNLKSVRGKGWETDYEVIQRKFREKGYTKVPEIVFWNLRDSAATPVVADQSGVALVSGFSKNMAKLFLETGGIISPEIVMKQAISGELYQKLVVYD